MRDDVLARVREEARTFERTLPYDRRKALGQFFTGMKVSRLLAHLAIDDNTKRVLDPMAGGGDLLDAVCESLKERGRNNLELDAIEIHSGSANLCERRLQILSNGHDGVGFRVIHGDAFSTRAHKSLPGNTYDLVIANPPYVRYQALNGRGESVRCGLEQIISEVLEGPIRDVWGTLAACYSGHSDLSVPAWILCGLLVRPGGRLAMVVPATWRSRAYADIVRYLLLRAFALELVIEDTHPGWFPDALVGTHLVVARRLSNEVAAVPLMARTSWSENPWVQVWREAASAKSLVGGAARGGRPEAAFASWCRSGDLSDPRPGVTLRMSSHRREWVSIRHRAGRSHWLQKLEPSNSPASRKFGMSAKHCPDREEMLARLPDPLRDVVPKNLLTEALRSIEELGIKTGQGLRTGCNRFFYVRLVEQLPNGWSTVVTNPLFGPRTLRVPTTALRPVLHRQTELDAWRRADVRTRVLDLRGWALPEDLKTVATAFHAYRPKGEGEGSREEEEGRGEKRGVERGKQAKGECKGVLRRMPRELAEHVRYAANMPIPGAANGRTVSTLSAVRTNVRPARANVPPRFWYMLPDFAPRHLPDAFVARVLHGAPQVHANPDPSILIDANFSTFRSDEPQWLPEILAALFNSVWFKVLMEATGTRLGGGALKLEASHLKRLLAPTLPDEAYASLGAAIRSEMPSKRKRMKIDRIVLRALLPTGTPLAEVDSFASALDLRRRQLHAVRRKIAL
ncbi:MAG: N-6 DNA methylase [Gammaproteobacteria bacterium]|nr:N-6 DNA methylase [Gammaproteobacteria bacterium]